MATMNSTEKVRKMAESFAAEGGMCQAGSESQYDGFLSQVSYSSKLLPAHLNLRRCERF